MPARVLVGRGIDCEPLEPILLLGVCFFAHDYGRCMLFSLRFFIYILYTITLLSFFPFNCAAPWKLSASSTCVTLDSHTPTTTALFLYCLYSFFSIRLDPSLLIPFSFTELGRSIRRRVCDFGVFFCISFWRGLLGFLVVRKAERRSERSKKSWTWGFVSACLFLFFSC